MHARVITCIGIRNRIFTHHHPCSASCFVMHAHNKSFTVHYAYTIALTVHVLKCAYVFTTVHNQLIIHAKCLLVTTIHVASVYMYHQLTCLIKKRIPFSTLAKYGACCGVDFQCKVLLNQELSLHQIELRLWIQFLANP